MPQQRYRTAMVEGRAGMVADGRDSVVTSRNNVSGAVAQVATYTVDTARNSHLYTLEINGIAITYTSDASGTTAEISAGLATAINAEPLVNGDVIATSSDPDTVVTARQSGRGFTATESDDDLSLVQTTANANATAVPFGRGLMRDGTSDENAELCASAQLTAKVVNATPANVNDATYYCGVTIDGVTAVAEYLADASATVKEIVEGLKAKIDAACNATFGAANSVAVTEDDTKLIFTAEIAGLDFDVTVGSDAATATWTVTESGDTIADVFLGVSVEDMTEEMVDGVAQYAANSAMSCLEEGRIFVATEESCSPGDSVYVGVGSSHEGKWRKSASTTLYLKLPASRARWVRNVSSSLAVLELSR